MGVSFAGTEEGIVYRRNVDIESSNTIKEELKTDQRMQQCLVCYNCEEPKEKKTKKRKREAVIKEEARARRMSTKKL